MIAFTYPWWLAALPLPWLVWTLRARLSALPVPRRRGGEPPAVVHPDAALLHDLARGRRGGRGRLPWLWALGCAALVVAAAGPVWLSRAGPQWHSGRDLILAVDLSGSMRALDYRVDGKTISRLDMTKRILDRFLRTRNGDRVGLIVFADEAYTLIPVTADIALIRKVVRQLGHGVLGEKTALGTAVALGVKRLKDRRPAARILVVLTDGSNTAGAIRPADAVLLARRFHVHVYTVGVGTNKEVLFPKGPVIPPELTHLPLDEGLLRGIAAQTGGRYFPITRTGDVRDVVQTIDDLEAVPIADQDVPDRDQWYWLPLAAGLALLLAHQRRRPRETAV